jgi:hypothetical protein
MAAISAPPQLSFLNSSGVPFAGYKLFTYLTGTTTKKTTYPTAADMDANTNPNANPIILDANGSAPIWFAGTVKYVLAPPNDTDPPLSPIATWDSVPSVSTIQIDQFFEAPAPDVISLKPGIDLGIYSGQFIVDENLNPYMQFVKVANAVNYVKITNAATGQPPRIESAGGDTNVGLLISVKNTGDLSLTTGDGDIFVTSIAGDVRVEGTDANIIADGGQIDIVQEGSRTNTVANINVRAPTSGTPANGIGIGINFKAASADETDSDFGNLNFSATDVGSGSEDTKFSIQTRTGGAALATSYEFGNGANKVIFNKSAITADRTITIPDSDTTLAAPATRADEQTPVSTAVYTNPAVQHFHPSNAKATAYYNVNTTSLTSMYNVISFASGGTGIIDLTLGTGMSGDYAIVTTVEDGANSHATSGFLTSTTFRVVSRITTTGSAQDESFGVALFGTLV